MSAHCEKYLLLLALGLFFIPASFAQSANPAGEFSACAEIADRDARYSCYDDIEERARREKSVADESISEEPIAEEPIAEEPIVEEAPPETVAQPEAAVAVGIAADTPSLPDDLGGPEFEDPSKPVVQHRGLITSCKEGRDFKWSFYFDNGQVWKQTNSRILRFNECNFIATITQDGFGYKMQIDGQKMLLRVSRKR